MHLIRSRPSKFHFSLVIFLFFYSVSPLYAISEDLKKAQSLNESAIKKINRGDIDGAEQDLLQALIYSKEEPKIRKNLGAVYYEKGMRFQQKKNYLEAIRYLGQALQINPEDVRYKKSYAATLFLQAFAKEKEGRNEEAFGLLKKAVEMDQTNLTILVHTAEFSWKIQKIDFAMECFQRAKALSPEDPNVKVLEKRLKNPEKETNLSTFESEHFIFSSNPEYIKLLGSHPVMRTLETAYQEVCFKLNFHPKTKIPVVFYPIKDFRQYWHVPGRVSGIFDGKLRIPYYDPNMDPGNLQPIVKHELSHAIVRLMTDKPIPQWLNEGLAQWMEGKAIEPKAKDALAIYQVTRRIPDIHHLEETFKQSANPYNNTEMTLAYMKAYSLVDYMIERYGLFEVGELIKNSGDKNTMQTFFKNRFKLSIEEFEAQWFLWFERKKGLLLN